MDFLRRVYKERKKYFENLETYVDKIKIVVKGECPDAQIYVFGSVVEGDYSIGLSDIDIAVVSEMFKNRDKKLEVFGKLTKIFFDSPFEFHLFTMEQWENFKNFRKFTRK